MAIAQFENMEFRERLLKPGEIEPGLDIRAHAKDLLKRLKLAPAYDRLFRFLLNCYLNDRVPTQSLIAEEVFKRSAKEFDPRSDSIVRTTAAQLRHEIDHFYRHAGALDKIKLRLPSGSYRLELFRDDIDARVLDVIMRADMNVLRGVPLRGLRCDFLVQMPNDSFLVIETKTWPPTKQNQTRAISQAQMLREATGVERIAVVMQGLKEGQPAEGLYSEAELNSLILEAATQGPSRARTTTDTPLADFKHSEISETKPVEVFAAMPFTSQYDDVYFVAMAHAAASVNAVCRRVDHEDFDGDITEKIRLMIGASAAVIIDLSESKPNVLYETGFAHALNIPAVHICSTPVGDLPFDVRNWNTLTYEKGQTFKLRDRLSQRLKAILKH